MGVVPVYRYAYGRQFEYIFLGMMEGKVLVFILDESRGKLGILRILPALHKLNNPVAHITILQANTLIRSRIEYLRAVDNITSLDGWQGWSVITFDQKRVIEDLAIREMGRLMYLTICIVRIQRNWRRAISNPWYHVCKKRLMKEYFGMVDMTPLVFV